MISWAGCQVSSFTLEICCASLVGVDDCCCKDDCLVGVLYSSCSADSSAWLCWEGVDDEHAWWWDVWWEEELWGNVVSTSCQIKWFYGKKWMT